MKSLVDLFPIIFEIPKDDVAWYDSLGMCDDAYYEEFESSAKEYAMMAVENPHEYMDAVDATSYRFVSGASWYACNKRLLENYLMTIALKPYIWRFVFGQKIYVKELSLMKTGIFVKQTHFIGV